VGLPESDSPAPASERATALASRELAAGFFVLLALLALPPQLASKSQSPSDAARARVRFAL
jgi:hypothetical protein